MDRTLCFDNSNEISGSCQVPREYYFVFGTIRPNATIPEGGRGVCEFTVTSDVKFDFDIKSLKTLSIVSGTEQADLSYFMVKRSEKSFKTIELKIMKPFESPQEIQLDFWIRFSGKTRDDDGIVGAKVFIVVSK